MTSSIAPASGTRSGDSKIPAKLLYKIKGLHGKLFFVATVSPESSLHFSRLFMAGVGLNSGGGIVEIVQSAGFKLIGAGSVVTLVPML